MPGTTWCHRARGRLVQGKGMRFGIFWRGPGHRKSRQAVWMWALLLLRVPLSGMGTVRVTLQEGGGWASGEEIRTWVQTGSNLTVQGRVAVPGRAGDRGAGQKSAGGSRFLATPSFLVFPFEWSSPARERHRLSPCSQLLSLLVTSCCQECKRWRVRLGVSSYFSLLHCSTYLMKSIVPLFLPHFW